MIPFLPPAQVQAPPPAPLPLQEALDRLLDQFDRQGDGTRLPDFPVAPEDQPRLRWLRAAATEERPGNPFSAGSPAWAEAESIRALLQAPAGERMPRLAALAPREEGSQLALWRWGKRLSRAGALDPALRGAWEDLLLAFPRPTLVSSYALRHALSFALARQDLDRFTDLKARFATRDPDQVFDIQRLFGLLATPGPVFTFWRLPGLTAEERSLGSLAERQVWITPVAALETPELPAGTVWLVPAEKAPDPPVSDEPPPTPGSVATKALQRLKSLDRHAWFSPDPEDLESVGLSLFPILIELDGKGNITGIRMGDAAPAKP